MGVTAALLSKPGVGTTGLTFASAASVTQAPSLISWLVSLIPVNPLEALSTGNLLQVIFSAALFGVGIQMAQEKAKPFVDLVESIYFIIEKILSVILYVAAIMAGVDRLTDGFKKCLM